MWNISRPFGQTGPVGPCFKAQKRDFSLNLSSVAIAPGKSFKNPNFVNIHHASVHSHYNNSTYSPIHNICHTQIDIPETVKGKFVAKNSSQNIVDSIKENPCECPINKIPVESNQMCYSRKRCKKNRRNRKKKVPNKNSKQNNSMQQISDMMEVDLEPDISMSSCDVNMTTALNVTSPACLSLTDYIVDISNIPNKSSKSDDEVFTFISISPPINNKLCPRERELSVCESEDSFIVFDSGTDEELNFSEDSDSTELESEDDDDSDSEIDDDFDSSCSVVPCKRVRFAENEELCEIHPMVQWSFAYKKARKGPWEEYARDRERFNKRINEIEMVLAPIFDRNHREHVYKERFDDSVGY